MIDVPLKHYFTGFGFPEPDTEVRFHPTRQWRWDYAYPALKVAVEVHGGIWRKGGGAHQGMGHLRDLEKMNAGQLEGWIVLQYTPEQMRSGEFVPGLQEALRMRAKVLP